MGLQQSKTGDLKPSRSKSSLSEKQTNPSEILQFASQLNFLVTSNMKNQTERYEFLVFNKIPFAGKFTPLPKCQRISFPQDSVFICYDCSTDPNAYLCEVCFEKGNHEGHRFSIFPNNAGWKQLYCRCGDYEYMKKGSICQEHKQAKVMPTVFVDPKEKKTLTLYLDEILKALFSLMKKGSRGTNFLNAFLMYLQKTTQNNLLFSKTLCQFLLQKAPSSEHTNLFELLKRNNIDNTKFFRNISFAPEYKLDILRQIILALNEQPKNMEIMSELILNFDGKLELLQKLAYQQQLILGLNPAKIQSKKPQAFYNKLIQKDFPANEIWKCIIQKRLVKSYLHYDNVMKKIIVFLNENKKNQELKISYLEQLLECDINPSHLYVMPMLMMISPEWFLPVVPVGGKANKGSSLKKNLEPLLNDYYLRIFNSIATNTSNQEFYEKYLLLLPFLPFGQQLINKLWEEIDRRVFILEKNKEKKVIRNGSMNFFTFLTRMLQNFYGWEHETILTANRFGLKSFSHDNKKLIQKLLRQQFDKKRKIFRNELLGIVDVFTQKERSFSTEVIEKSLRYNVKKDKYYFVEERLGNNPCNYEQLQVGTALKLNEWQQIVASKIFPQKVYQFLPRLIKIAQNGLMQDMEMVKTVSNISISLSLLNKNQQPTLKKLTRNFIKQISDVSQQVYYILAAIRDRFQLDIDEVQEQGQRGRKKQKLDLITEIRDKKYKQIKQMQNKILQKWLKEAQQAEHIEEDTKQENFCHICKEKSSINNRLVYLCNFTRNNVVSTLLKSQVTDLDINICLHKVHEKCYQKVENKRHCPVCKFEVNCYIPEKPLKDESYTKNWLRNFENIITRINLQSGKSFNSDWATIFLTYLVFSRSFKVLLKSSEIQQKQLQKIDELLILHYKNQLEKWPQLAKQAIKRAEKTVKGQVARESNIKKNVKSLVLDLVLQQITEQPFKNEKRIEKKIRELVNFVGKPNAEKITAGFKYCRENDKINEIIDQSIEENEEEMQLFRIKQLPQTAQEYLKKKTILCPMCNKYQQSTWQCLFCDKVSCQNCNGDYQHTDKDHRGSCIYLFLNSAEYKLVHENREVKRNSLFRNQYDEGWKRNMKPDGWKCCTKEIDEFFDDILHSKNVFKVDLDDTNSDNLNNPIQAGGLFGGVQNNWRPFGQNNNWNQNNNNNDDDDDEIIDDHNDYNQQEENDQEYDE